MKIGVGLPATIPGAFGPDIVEWARRAEAGPFSSLGVVDRLVYPNHDPLVSLAAAAAVTSRVQLMTTVLLTPLRNEMVLAQTAATIQSISQGRFSLGLGIGWRKDDLDAAGVPFEGRGTRLEGQLATMRAIWAGEAIPTGDFKIGPPIAKPPEVLMGAMLDGPLRRVGRLADAYLAAPDPVSEIERKYAIVCESWSKAGKPGKPRMVGGLYYVLGDLEKGYDYMRDYYDFAGSELAEEWVRDMISTPQQVREAMREYESIGMDEMLFHPCVANLDELARLADIVG
jgi:alkanesulfonate monooxygenase SsuD/methylene tetrahydromethanopterin reductase-like flavin-dependent oxidoreductase (luciferase family)